MDEFGLPTAAEGSLRAEGAGAPLPGIGDHFVGGGELGAAMRGHDWARTPLGPPEAWPPSLLLLIDVMMAANQPMYVAWGPARTLLYNDAYIPLLGRKHPGAFARPFLDVWSEAREDLTPLLDRAFAGEPIHMDHLALQLERHGQLEEAHFAFSFTPVRDESGAVAGLFCACAETTGQVLAERRAVAETDRLRQMFAQAPGSIAVLRGPDHVFELANLAYLERVGHRDIIGRPVREALPEVVDQGFVDLLDKVYRTGEAFVGRSVNTALHRVPGAAAEDRLVDFVYQPMTDAEGRVTGIFVEATDVTDQVRTEARLREQAARSRQILDSAVDYAIISSDLAGRITTWNEGAHRLLGWTEAEMLGQSPNRFFTPEDVAAGRPEIEMRCALDQGRAKDERWHRRKGGERFWAVGELTPLMDEGGAAVGFVKVMRDRTEERLFDQALVESEARLRLSEESLRLATEAAEIGTWDLDLATDILTWSDRTKAMFGISPDVPCSMADFYAGLHPEDREATGAAFAAALDPATRTTYDVEYRTIGREDGIVRWVAARGKALFDERGRCLRALGTAIDVTRRKAAESRRLVLLDLADRLRILSEPRAVMQAAVDVLGRHLGAHRVGFGPVGPDDASVTLETEYLDGVDPLAGVYRLDAFGPGTIADLQAGRTAVYPDAEADPGTASIGLARFGIAAIVAVPLLRDGRLRSALYVAHAEARAWMPEEVRLIEEVAARIWDAVERAWAEDALRELNATLEARVAERTAELEHAEAALRQAQKMEAVGQLTGGIAHDFNNLLTGVIGSLDMMQRRISQGRTGEIERYATLAMTSANRAAALTHRLLAFSRRQPLDPKPVGANRLVTGMEELLRRTIGEAIRLEIVTEGGLWLTMCDPHQLENAILNLAINARDAMPDGGRLTIETCNAHLDSADAAKSRDVRPGQYVCICVTDTGTGMSADVIAKAFDPFFTTKPIGQGTGLGLSMIYGFTRQSEGYARIYSEVGQGTTVKIYLPRYHGEAEPAETGAGRLEEEHRAEHGEVVLVVEDETAVRDLVRDVLGDLGYRAIEAADGPSGLKLLQSDLRIDLLVTDVGLPGLNGRQLADAARASRPGLKVLFMTGYAENATVAGGFLDPGMQMITKPFAIEALAGRIRDMIEAGGGSGQGVEKI